MLSLSLTLLVCLGCLLFPISFLLHRRKQRLLRQQFPSLNSPSRLPVLKALLIGLFLGLLIISAVRLLSHLSTRHEAAQARAAGQTIVETYSLLEDSYHSPNLSIPPTGPSNSTMVFPSPPGLPMSAAQSTFHPLFFILPPALISLAYAGYHLFLFTLLTKSKPPGFAIVTPTP